MSANNSKQQADNANSALDTQQLKRVRTAITQAASEGLYEVMIFETISRVNVDLLQGEKYRVSRRGGRMGENNYIVIWAKPKNPDDDSTYTTYYPGGTPDEHPPL